MTTVKLLRHDDRVEYGSAIVEWAEKALRYLQPDNWKPKIHGSHYVPRGRRPEPSTLAVRSRGALKDFPNGETFLSFRFAILREDIFGDLEKGLQTRRRQVKAVAKTLLMEADTAARKRFRELCKEVPA